MKDKTLKETNPKDVIGSNKIPIHLWPTTATLMGTMALLDGALKYGRTNYRAVGVRASIYYDALMRHSMAWFEGEENDPDSGLPHLAHALACLAIIVDADAKGCLTDDRVFPGGYRKCLTQLTPYVQKLKELHKDKNPKHYTIEDVENNGKCDQCGNPLKNNICFACLIDQLDIGKISSCNNCNIYIICDSKEKNYKCPNCGRKLK